MRTAGAAAARSRAWIRTLERRSAAWPLWVRDAPLALCCTAATVVYVSTPSPANDLWERPDALAYALICVINLSLAARRLAPVLTFALTSTLWMVFVAAGYWPIVNSLCPMVTLYAVAASRPAPVAMVCGVCCAGCAVLSSLLGDTGDLVTTVAQAAVMLLIILKFGGNARQLAQRNADLSDLAAQLRREREENARRAVAEERVRIARELHDVVAHHMSVVSVQAGLARYVFTSDPATARDALGTISASSGEALEEMRRLLAVLRVGPEGGDESGHPEGDCPYHPMPGLDRLEATVERMRSVGVRVDLEVTGERRPLAAGPDLCAYRVVQEALTNIIKHAGAARAVVRVAFRPHELELSVTDDGRPSPRRRRNVPANPVPSGGHGLIGMRERARIYGGRLAAGPRADGGFEVRLTLPLQ
ncbi:sensor histidine kinase [Streptomyces sp. NPDC021100]|uniref:sensor histidine kinase n=1 Tax=Streptomyces sp. NPDC021100 TaxID=3365114 RepID=UPI003799C80F